MFPIPPAPARQAEAARMLRTDVLDRGDSIAGEETLSHRVVVIDDDDAILESLEALFATAGY